MKMNINTIHNPEHIAIPEPIGKGYGCAMS